MKVIVTGAGRGIGEGIACVLAEAGHAVGLVARSADALAKVKGRIQARGGKAVTAVGDVSDHLAIEEAIGELIDGLGGVDGLVNNAGLILIKPILEMSTDDWQAVMRTNVDGVFYATRAVLPHFKQQRHGHIVNISSISGYMALPGGCAYAASKHAVTGFSESLMQEVRDWGVKVTTVFPGSVATGGHPVGHADEPDWMVHPDEVGHAVLAVLDTRQGNLISRVEIRPLGRPPKKPD